MRRAYGVAAHCFQHPGAESLQGIGQGSTHASVILMVTGALDRGSLAVQEKASIRIESQRAHAKHSLVTVTCAAAGLHGSDGAIEIRLFR